MDATLSTAAALIGAPNAQFLALLFIGGAIGWCAMKFSRVDVRSGALLLAAVTGAWLAAEFAVGAGVGQRCADAVLIAGAIGAALFCLAWRALRHFHGPAHIAVRH
jgi:uncharacterized membrane protein YeaQ/YmgE (transglycosylase-associated protein family)